MYKVLKAISLLALLILLSSQTLAQERASQPDSLTVTSGTTILVPMDELPRDRPNLRAFLIAEGIPTEDAGRLASMLLRNAIPRQGNDVFRIPNTVEPMAASTPFTDSRVFSCSVSSVAWWQQGRGSYVSTMSASNGETDPVPGISANDPFFGIHYARVDDTFDKGVTIIGHRIQVVSLYLTGYWAGCLGF